MTIAVDDDQVRAMRDEWDELDTGVPLKVRASPYREVVAPVVAHVREPCSDNPRDVVVVYIPELVVGHWWERAAQPDLAVHQDSPALPGVITTAVPYQLASSRYAIERAERSDTAEWRRPGTGTVHSGASLDD